MKLVYSEDERPVRPLVPNRKRRPKMKTTYHVHCVDCGATWTADWWGGVVKLRREATNHECRP